MMSEPVLAAYKAYFVDLPLTVTNEALRFAAHRLQEQAKLVSALISSKSLSEAAEAQSAFLRGAIGDYRKEAGTVVHRARDVVSQ
ncbi:MAG: phasin family protein [Hyphomicrobiales bacterium]